MAKIDMARPALQVHRPALTQTSAVKRITGTTLQAIRRKWFYKRPLCVRCEQQGFVVKATELDHIIPLYKGGKDDDSNRQGLCSDCHKDKTREDMQR